MTRRMLSVRACEVAPAPSSPRWKDDRSDLARWRVWAIAGQVMFAVCVGLLIVAVQVTS